MSNNQNKQVDEQKQKSYKFVTIKANAIKTSLMKLRPFVQQLLNSSQWNLSDRAFRDYGMIQIFRTIETCEARTLKLDYNKFPHIIKSITNIKFSRLIDLSLGDNNLFSIESLCEVDMPELVTLHLNDNPITNLSPLRRCYFPKIQYISLRDIKVNYEASISPLSEMNCPKLNKIIIDYMDSNLLNKKRGQLHKGNWITPYKKDKKDGIKNKTKTK